MRKTCFAIWLILGLAVSATIHAADVKPPANATVGEFMELVITAMGIEAKLPPNLGQMPADQAFQVECNLLTAYCIPFFNVENKDRLLSRGLFADVIFQLVKRNLGMWSDNRPEKIRMLVEQKLMEPGLPADPVTLNEVRAVLNNPLLTDGLEGYITFLPCLGTQPADPVFDPFGAYRVKNVTEELPSPFKPWQVKK